MPCISQVENERVNLAAELVDGTILRGQNEISHPSIDSKTYTKVVTTPANPEVVSKDFWKQVLESGEFPESGGTRAMGWFTAKLWGIQERP